MVDSIFNVVGLEGSVAAFDVATNVFSGVVVEDLKASSEIGMLFFFETGDVFLDFFVGLVNVGPHLNFSFSVSVVFRDSHQVFLGVLVCEDGDSLFAELISPGLELGSG